MKSIFSIDNRFFRTVNTLIDIVFLNILWVLCVLPVFTIGAATAALLYSLETTIHRRESYPAKAFFHSFRDNLVQGTLIQLILMGLTAVFLYSDVAWIVGFVMKGKSVGWLALGIFILKMVVLVSLWLFVFPVLSRFKGSTISIIENAFSVALHHPVQNVAISIVVVFGGVLIATESLLVLIVPACVCELVLFILRPVLHQVQEQILAKNE